MHDWSRLSETIVAIAPRLGIGEIAGSEDGGTLTLVFDPARILFLDLDPGRNILVISCALQPASSERLAALHKLFLQVGALWRDTDGSRIALEPTDDQPVLLLDVGLAGLDAPALESTVRSFLDRAAGWNALIAGKPEDGRSTAVDTASLMIRI